MGYGKVTYARTHQYSTNPYETVEEILFDLHETFDDPDREENHNREYQTLTQGSKRFIDFFMDFRRLANQLEFNDETMVRDLKAEISPRLRTARANSGVDLSTTALLRTYLTKVDYEHRAMREVNETQAAKELNRPRLMTSSSPRPKV